jgi:hypothetical protein
MAAPSAVRLAEVGFIMRRILPAARSTYTSHWRLATADTPSFDAADGSGFDNVLSVLVGCSVT